jgi:trk system potassium uptake protein TrkA
MHVVIVGCGRVGAALAHSLAEDTHEVVVIDRNPAAFARLPKAFGGRLVTGVAFDRDVLAMADIEGTDAFAAVTSGDNTNIVCAVIAKDIFGVKHVVARINDPRRAEIYRREGISTVSPTLWGAQTIRNMLVAPRPAQLSTFGSGEVELLHLEVPAHLAGRPLRDLSLGGRAVPAALIRRGQATIPDAATTLAAGDEVVVAAPAGLVGQLDRLLGE